MNAVTKTEAQVFQAGFSRIAPQIKAALPTHIPYERFERTVMVAVQREPKLLRVNQRSLFLACQRAANDGLMPDGREGAIVIFGNEAQWMPMVHGIRKLAYNTGEIASITAEVAYDCDKFVVIKGDDPKIIHEPCMDPPDGAKMIAAYMIAKLKNGEVIREVMTRKQIEKVKAISRNKGGLLWTTFEEEGWRKSVIRRGAKQLPLSADRDSDLRMQRAIERIDDDTVIEGKAIDPSAIDEAAASTRQLESPTPSKLDALESMADPDALDGEGEEIEVLPDPERDHANELTDRIAACQTEAEVRQLAANAAVKRRMAGWKGARPELFAAIDAAVAARLEAVSIPVENDPEHAA